MAPTCLGGMCKEHTFGLASIACFFFLSSIPPYQPFQFLEVALKFCFSSDLVLVFLLLFVLLETVFKIGTFFNFIIL